MRFKRHVFALLLALVPTLGAGVIVTSGVQAGMNQTTVATWTNNSRVSSGCSVSGSNWNCSFDLLSGGAYGGTCQAVVTANLPSCTVDLQVNIAGQLSATISGNPRYYVCTAPRPNALGPSSTLTYSDPITGTITNPDNATVLVGAHDVTVDLSPQAELLAATAIHGSAATANFFGRISTGTVNYGFLGSFNIDCPTGSASNFTGTLYVEA